MTNSQNVKKKLGRPFGTTKKKNKHGITRTRSGGGRGQGRGGGRGGRGPDKGGRTSPKNTTMTLNQGQTMITFPMTLTQDKTPSSKKIDTMSSVLNNMTQSITINPVSPSTPSNKSQQTPIPKTITPEKNIAAHHTSAPTPNMIHGLAKTATSSKAPIERSMIDQISAPNYEHIATVHKMRVLYRTQVNASKDTDVIEKMKCLMARLIRFEPSVQMLPFCPQNKSNPIGNAKDIPTEPDAFQIYVPQASINSNSHTLRMSFRISSESRLWKLKMIPSVRNYLNQFKIYLDETFLTTWENAKVGGLILSHCQWTRRDEATRDINIRINKNEEDKTPIQLAPYTMWNGRRDDNKISTKLLAVECAKEHIEQVKHRMFTKLLNVPTSMLLSNTKYFKFIPFTPSGAITEAVIRSGIYLQNKFLIQSTAVTMVNINNLD